jgi:3-oxoacyl-[acyl-carrier-protein] synthase-3
MSDFNIIGSGTYLPGKAIGNDVLSSMLNLNKEWIDYFIGTKTRHFSIDVQTDSMLNNLSQMSFEAAKLAMKDAEVNPHEINAVVLATATPDHLMPTSVNMIADMLAINNVPTYQLQSGCSGAIQALDFSCQLLKGKTLKNILVIGADTCNKCLDFKQDFSKLSRNELINYVLFGDGAGAIILSSSKRTKALKVKAIVNKFVGLNKKPGQIINWFSSKKQLNEFSGDILAEDYKEIENQVPIMSKEVLIELLENTGWNIKDIDFLLPPQLSKSMTEKIIHFMVGDQEINTINFVETSGNNGNALAFMQIDQLLKTALPGNKALLVAIESSKWIKSGVALYA